jgi:hypothetical protein
MLYWLRICTNKRMKIELDLTTRQIKSLVLILNNDPEFAGVGDQLVNINVKNNDSQGAEISEQGDKEIITRDE